MLQFAHRRSRTRHVTNAATLCVLAVLSACTDSGGSSARDGSSISVSSLSPHTYSLTSTISGLNSSGLVLMVSAQRQISTAHLFPMADELNFPARMSSATAVSVTAGQTLQGLASSLPAGSSYSVTVQTQPVGEACTVAGGTGTIQSASAANVVVTCLDQAYPVGGTISGLTGSGMVLANGSDTIAPKPGASSFTMPTPVTYSSAYAVTVQAQPPGLTCTVNNGAGTMGSAAVTNIGITCSVNTYTVSGTISGLTTSALVLLNNGGDATTTGVNATQFTMNTAVAYGSAYAIAVQSEPTGLVCPVSNGAGTMGPAAVTSVSIACVSNFTLLYSFAGGSDAADPYHTLIQDSDGTFYGTTLTGGVNNTGAVFKITPSGTETVFYSFTSTPYSGLTEGSDNNIYGTTAGGGTSGRGTVFRITPSGTETVLFSFPAGSSDPYTGLIQGSDGNFYGTTGAGGTNDDGTVFRITPSGTETVLHAFAKTGTDGQTPYAGLIQGSDGNLYGTTYFGGSNGFGTVFKVTLAGTETVLYSFGAGNDGQHPYAGVIQGSDGNLYGTTYQGGTSGLGTVYKITPGGTETVLHSFVGGNSDGASPEAGVIQGTDGNLYGNTLQGGAAGLGTVFKFTPGGVETILHVFAGSSDGANPSANLVQGTDGNLYGSTGAGGVGGYGTFFKVALH